MEVAPFFVDFHHFLSIFTIFLSIFTIYALLSRFTFCRDLRTFSAIFFGQNSLLRNITLFLHVWCGWGLFKSMQEVLPYAHSGDVLYLCWAAVMCRRTVFTFGFLGVGRLPALGLITAPNWKPLVMYALHYTVITIVGFFFYCCSFLLYAVIVVVHLSPVVV